MNPVRVAFFLIARVSGKPSLRALSQEGMTLTAPLLEIRNLQTHYFGPKGQIVRAVDGIDLAIEENEVVGLVGESGCGKSATGLSILRLTPPPGRIVNGSIKFGGVDLARAPEEEVRKIRGKEIAMVFQDPMTSLNPSYTVRWQISEAIHGHFKLKRNALEERVLALLKAVGIGAPEERAREYPHRLSGGMRQRVMIAMALACHPRLLIADEPTTALDVTVQAQILDLLRNLQKEYRMSVLLISHDLGIVSEMSQRVTVMYAGQIVEEARVSTLFANPRHPYTQALLESIPARHQPKAKLQVIPGKVPDMVNLPPGCRFHPRCASVGDECRRRVPELVRVGENHRVRCLMAGGNKGSMEGSIHVGRG
jgi:peptide/nickel transport system ATP-binding protein